MAWKPVEGVTCTPRADNPRHFDITIAGPPDSPFEGGVFRLEMFLPGPAEGGYPLLPPLCRFLTKVYQLRTLM